LSDLLRLPEQRCTFVALANASPAVPGFEPAAFTRQMARKFLADEIKKLPPLRENTAVDKSAWPDLSGRYDYGNAVLTVTVEGGRLYAQLTGQLKYEIFPKAPDEFFWKVADAHVIFLRNAKGEVVAARHTQNGGVFHAPRLGRFQLDKRRRDMFLSSIGNFVLPVSVLCVPIWFFGRKRVRWTALDFSAAWLPLVIWFGLLWLNWTPLSLYKTAEPFFVGVLLPACPLLRLTGRHWLEEKKMARVTAALGAALACAVYFVTPRFWA
jgi:hypothetical protein